MPGALERQGSWGSLLSLGQGEKGDGEQERRTSHSSGAEV